MNINKEKQKYQQKVFELLLLAGYFRCRIARLSEFDKLLGGMVWAISCSNYDIDIDYDDDMNLGQKIKISEKIIKALKRMKCPHKLYPQQIQGLNFKSILPVMKWLIKFVYATRDQRADINQNIVNFIGKQIFQEKEKEEVEESALMKRLKNNRRVIKNKRAQEYESFEPIMVYSTLLEYDDKTAIRPYQKLSLRRNENYSLQDSISRKSSGSKQMRKSNTIMVVEDQDDIFNTEDLEEIKQLEELNEEEFQMINPKRRQSIVGGRQILNLVRENQEQIEDAMQIEEDEDKEDDEQIQLANMIKNEKQFHEEKMQRMKRQLEKLQEETKIHSTRQKELKKQNKNIRNEVEKHQQHELNIIETSEMLQSKINQAEQDLSIQQFSGLKNLLNDFNELKTNKQTFKRDAKAEMKKIEEEKKKLEDELPELDEEAYAEVEQDYKTRKTAYDKIFKTFAKSNQKIAILERELEKYPAPIEITQFYQRFVELFDDLQEITEKIKDNYSISNNLYKKQEYITSQIGIMKDLQGRVQDRKMKKNKKVLLETFKDLNSQMKNQKAQMQNGMQKLQTRKVEAQMILKKFRQEERDYHIILRELQAEYDLNEELVGDS